MNLATSIDKSTVEAYQTHFDQLVDSVSFLWILRSIAVDQPNYYKSDILELEQRIEDCLDGLMTSIELAWPLCADALDLAEPGEVFTAAVVAFRSHDMNHIQQVVDIGLSNDTAVKGLISALGWLPGNLVHSWIKKFFTSKDLNHKFLAIAACSVRRENPEEYLNNILERSDCKAHVRLYSRSLRLIGELRRLDLMPYLEEALNSDDDALRFWAIWSSILLGKHEIVKKLEPYVFNSGPYQELAINIAFRVLPIEQARGWISTLAKTEGQIRNVIKASGILGDPHAVNWLINKMQDTSFAKLAGEAFTLITGVDLEEHQLIKESIIDQDLIDKDIPEEETFELDDENLPWPDQSRIKKLWMNHASNFITGQRYLLGKPITVELQKNRIDKATQRHRHALAIELALMGETPLINTRSKISP